MRPIEEIQGAIDDALARAGFRRTSDGFIMRTYETVLDGMRVTASLSVFIDTGTAHRLTSRRATGYDFAMECENGLSTRYVIGTSIPLLLGRGLPQVPFPAVPEARAFADDVPWLSSRLLSDAMRPAVEGLASHASFIEQRPGTFHVKFTRLGITELPPLDAVIGAFASIVRASMVPPLPKPAAARLSDNRVLMMVLVTVGVLGGFAGCFWSYYMLVR